MKEILIIISILTSQHVFARDAKDIRLNFGLQRNMPEHIFNKNISKSNGKNGGFGIHVFPKWFYTKHLSFGLNTELALVEEDYQTDKIDSYAILSFTPTAHYCFSNYALKPFIGLGIGSYSVIYCSPKINPGIRTIVGLNVYDYFELSIEYNKILTEIDVYPNGDFDNYYLAVKGSFSIGILRSQKQN